ncbi:MAG: SCO1664 family protein [Actinobacteria bacterium]|jgi:uncharacterized repeat protein (TIGR03843 family)|nr:SCO1664 family protein [Actinomycetota bacterium]MTA34792.1 SCO1664 family protein [Actinomycetota bacterium]
MSVSMQTLLSQSMRVVGRLIDASNATLLAEIESDNQTQKVIYKPVAGEKPLWDFQDGNLAHREYCAFLLSNRAGFDLVPNTVLRDGPFGFGMVQEWIDTDEEIDIINFGQSDDSQLKRMAIFDAIINNTDRKYGHLLYKEGKLLGCDHGVTFHSEDKLRTVIWQFSGEKIDKQEMLLIESASALDYPNLFESYLTQDEIAAIYERINRLLKSGRFPSPSENWPAIPWPPV